MIPRVFLSGAVWPALARLGGAAWLSGALGCATPAPSMPAAAATPVTHLLIVNQTNYDWRITISGHEHRDASVAPQASIAIDLAGGDYVIEQKASSPGAAPELTRRIPARLEPGQTYRWRLDTLLSDTSGDPARDQP